MFIFNLLNLEEKDIFLDVNNPDAGTELSHLILILFFIFLIQKKKKPPHVDENLANFQIRLNNSDFGKCTIIILFCTNLVGLMKSDHISGLGMVFLLREMNAAIVIQLRKKLILGKFVGLLFFKGQEFGERE